MYLKNLRLYFLSFPLKKTYFSNSWSWKNSNLFSNLRHNGLWMISGFLWYQMSYCLCFCEWIWESKVIIGNKKKRLPKATVLYIRNQHCHCFQELRNAECVTHIQTPSKQLSGVTTVPIYFIYLWGNWKIYLLCMYLNNYANMPGFTWNVKVMLERTRKDNFLLNQKVILHYYMKTRFTPAPLLAMSKTNFWWSCFSHPWAVFDPMYTHQVPSRHPLAGWHHSLDLACPHPDRNAWCPSLRLPLTVPPACRAPWLGVARWPLAEVLRYQPLGSLHQNWCQGSPYPTQQPEIYCGNLGYREMR